MGERRIKRALISVYDKTGIVDFARALVDEFGMEIISTGGTAALLKENGIPVTLVEQITGFPEMLDGRVKTLHPKIHAAILADRDNLEHMRQLKEQGIEPIDMVVVNLYPFEKTVADPNCTFEQAIEMIDIGGPCLLRAAAKNCRYVIPVIRPNGLEYVMGELREQGDLSETGRLVLASVAFEATSDYDRTVDEYMTHRWTELRCRSSADDAPAESTVTMALLHHLRLWKADECEYGENPHLRAAFYIQSASDLVLKFERSSSRAASFNNYVDAHAALELCKELSRGLPSKCGTGFQPVEQESAARGSGRWKSIEGDHASRRNLPHLETTGRSYFVTFKTKGIVLSPKGRDQVLKACQFWHGKKMTLHAVVVMPDHVHLLMTPFGTESGGTVALGEIIHSIKSYSANEVNKLENRTGPIWLDERWDRIMRNRKEFIETWEYIQNNPDRKGLGPDYKWFCSSPTEFQEGGFAHRQDAGATPQDPADSHRLEAGATRKVCVFIKHTNACGVGTGKSLAEAYRLAYLGDPNAAMGGVLACSFDVGTEFALLVMDTYSKWGKGAGAGGFFVEVWVAPTFGEQAVEVIRKSKPWGQRVRLLSVGDMSLPPDPTELEYKSITSGMLVQTRDLVGLNEEQWKVVTKRTPSESEISDLRLAWLIAKHTKSNAISVCKDGMLIGNGAGQMSRVMSCRIATWLAKENGHADKLPGSVAASDAFFPFADGPNILIDAGVTAIIQPGGSKRDAEVIAACDARNVGMIFTGTRHFKH